MIRLVFARFRELGSARQVLLSMAAERVHFPRPSDGKKLVAFDWRPIRYRSVISVLKNPFYAGGPWCTDQRAARMDPNSPSGSGDADGLRASELEHAVQGTNSDGGLGGRTAVRA